SSDLYPAHAPGPANRLGRAVVPVAGCGRPPARAAWRSAWSWPLPGRLFACRALHPDLRSVLIVPVVLPFVLEQAPALVGPSAPRSEERRVGKECRSRWSPYREKEKRRQ